MREAAARILSFPITVHRGTGWAGASGPGLWVRCQLLPEAREKAVHTEQGQSACTFPMPACDLRKATREQPGPHQELGDHALYLTQEI